MSFPSRIGRPRTCDCGECRKCQHRDAARRRYQALTIEERRALIVRRDLEKVKAAEHKRYRRDWEKRCAAAEAYKTAHPEMMREARQAWDSRNPEKRKAGWAVNNAVRDGRLVKKPCEICGSTRRIHGHHDDYSKPLEVRWLCPLHHGEHHARLRGNL